LKKRIDQSIAALPNVTNAHVKIMQKFGTLIQKWHLEHFKYMALACQAASDEMNIAKLQRKKQSARSNKRKRNSEIKALQDKNRAEDAAMAAHRAETYSGGGSNRVQYDSDDDKRSISLTGSKKADDKFDVGEYGGEFVVMDKPYIARMNAERLEQERSEYAECLAAQCVEDGKRRAAKRRCVLAQINKTKTADVLTDTDKTNDKDADGDAQMSDSVSVVSSASTVSVSAFKSLQVTGDKATKTSK
jgi:hypothetical protein